MVGSTPQRYRQNPVKNPGWKSPHDTWVSSLLDKFLLK
jgi:hypothetical protein